MRSAGLASQSVLSKIDRLRELNIGSMIPLPQLIVVGDQSSGKSSVLESLTGFSFPRAAGLCTRYATQITCCRDAVKSVNVSIIPRPEADDELKLKLLAFHRRFTELENDELATVFEEATLTMGIRVAIGAESPALGAFSQDILKIEVSGPDEVHLTVIDVPGIFRVPTPGLTTETDISLVENMVKSYMNNNRTIILPVMPCNVDIATQEILKLAENADPDGARTMGVLTKPDLTTESATREAVMDLIMGKRGNLKLGYFVVKNRSADDNSSSLTERAEAERVFFMAPPWSDASDRCGVTALKCRLRQLLTKICNQEFPHVKVEVEQRLRLRKTQLEIMGPARADQTSQRHTWAKPDLKLITKITKFNEDFSNTFWKRGHVHYFDAVWDDEGEAAFEDKSVDVVNSPLVEYAELKSVVESESYCCPRPLKGTIMNQIRNVYESNRGPELGTFGGTILSTIFEQQSDKWVPLALSHTSKTITAVHDFVYRLLAKLCPEQHVRDRLWDTLLVDRLITVYGKAMDHTRFLLRIEREGGPSTFNHYFNATLQKKRAERLARPLRDRAISFKGHEDLYVSIREINRCAVDKSNTEQVCEDILDTLTSYYKVSRKRFVDVVCQQVISYYLLDGLESPLKTFSADLVMGLDLEQLELIAGEDDESKQQRQLLEREIQSIEAALKVLRA